MVETTIASMWKASDSSLNPSANKAKLLAAINDLKTIGVKLANPSKSGSALARSLLRPFWNEIGRRGWATYREPYWRSGARTISHLERAPTVFFGSWSDALTIGGHIDSAYNLLKEEECPSWLYAVKQGGTTIWERWDSMLPDGTINPGEMTSFNHYALGAVVDWMQRVIGGLAALEPGYRKIGIRPRPGGGITHATTRHLTPYGMAEVAWKIENGTMHVDATVPTGTTATVELPGDRARELGPGKHTISVPVA